jgi:hypothetical protein
MERTITVDGVPFTIGALYEFASYEFKLIKFTSMTEATFQFTKGGAGYSAGQTINLGFNGRWKLIGFGLGENPRNRDAVKLLDKEW